MASYDDMLNQMLSPVTSTTEMRPAKGSIEEMMLELIKINKESQKVLEEQVEIIKKTSPATQKAVEKGLKLDQETAKQLRAIKKGFDSRYLDKTDKGQYRRLNAAVLKAPTSKGRQAALRNLQGFVSEIQEDLTNTVPERIISSIFGPKRGLSRAFEQMGSSLVTVKDNFLKTITGDSMLSKVTDGIVKNQLEMTSQMRMYAYEVGESADKAMELANATDSVSKTGKSLAENQKQYLKNLKLGIKDQNKAKRLSNLGLNLSTAIGSESEATADHMAKMNLHMGLTNIQATQFARHVKFTAEATGVTGDNLLNAVKQSEKFMKNMRNAGNLTGRSAGNIAQLSTALEKYGVGDDLNSLMEAISSPNKLLESTPQTQALAFRAARYGGVSGELRTGTLANDKNAMKSFTKGMERVLKDFTGGKELSAMSAEERRNVGLRFEKATGISIGAYTKSIEAMKEGTMTATELMKKYGDEIKSGTLTEKQVAVNRQKMASLTIKETGEVFSMFEEKLKAGGNVFGDLESMAKSGKLKDLKSFGIDVTGKNGQAIAQEMMDVQLKAVNELRSKAKLSAISGPEGTDNKSMLNFMNRVAEGQEEAEVALKKGQDPLTEAAQAMMELNKTLQLMIGGGTQGLLDTIGSYGIIATNIGMIAKDLGVLRPALGLVKSIFTGGGKGMMGFAGKALGDVGSLLSRGGGTMAKGGAAAAGALGGSGMLGTALKGLGAIASKVALPLLALKAGWDGFWGASKGWEKATETFGPNATFWQKLTSSLSGGLFGVLDGLTMGIFGNWLAPDGPIAKNFAIGLNAISTVVSSAFDVLFDWAKSWYEYFWGVTEKDKAKTAAENKANRKLAAPGGGPVSDFSQLKMDINKAQGGRSLAQVNALNAQTVGPGDAKALKEAYGTGVSPASMANHAAAVAEGTKGEPVKVVQKGVGDTMHQAVRREIANTSVEGGPVEQARSISRELQTQTLIAQQQVDLLRGILASLQTGESQVDTTSKLTYRKPAQYYKWSTRYTDNAQINVPVI